MKLHLTSDQQRSRKSGASALLLKSGVKINEKQEMKFLERNKVKALPYRIVQNQNQRNGFLKLDLNHFEKIDVDNIREHNDGAALEPLKYQLSKCMISEYEYDDYFFRQQQSIRENMEQSNSSRSADPDILQMDEQIQYNKIQSSDHNVFTKIIKIQQMQLQHLMWKKEVQKIEEIKANNATQNIEQAIKKKESELKKSKIELKQLKDDINVKEQLIEEIQKKLLVKCAYRCKLCKHKVFETEEFLKNHHKRKHPGVLDMHPGDLNFQMMECIQETKKLIIKRIEFNKNYFDQENTRIHAEISTDVIDQVQDLALQFKSELLEFHKMILQNANIRRAVSDQFQRENDLLSQQIDTLYEEIEKIYREIKEAEIECIRAFEERERERKRREQEERERLERLRIEEERLAKLRQQEEEERLKEQEVLKQKREEERKKRDKLRNKMKQMQEEQEMDEDEVLRQRILLEMKIEEEERKRKAEEDEKERIKQIKKTIKMLQKTSQAYFINFNRLVNKRKQGLQNYDDTQYTSLLSGQLFEQFQGILDKYKIPYKIGELTVKMSQMDQLQEVFTQVTENQVQNSGTSSQSYIDDKTASASEKKKMYNDIKNQQQAEEMLQEEEEEQNEYEEVENIEEGDQNDVNVSNKKSKYSKKVGNPLFDKLKKYRPYYTAPQVNAKLRDLQFKKEEDIQSALYYLETSDIYFAIGVPSHQKPRIIEDKINPNKQLNQNILVFDQNPLKIENIF